MNANDPNDIYPADIAPVARALDELAEADRRAAGPDLEPRLARSLRDARTTPALRLAAPGVPAPHSPETARPGGWLTSPSMRLAASVAIVAGALAAWLAMRPAGGAATGRPASLEQEVDAWLALAGPDDGLRTEIETLLLLSDDLARGLDSGWLEEELMGESL
jgi:hypothetical protein